LGRTNPVAVAQDPVGDKEQTTSEEEEAGGGGEEVREGHLAGGEARIRGRLGGGVEQDEV
jgi:hypothetical protein